MQQVSGFLHTVQIHILAANFTPIFNIISSSLVQLTSSPLLMMSVKSKSIAWLASGWRATAAAWSIV